MIFQGKGSGYSLYLDKRVERFCRVYTTPLDSGSRLTSGVLNIKNEYPSKFEIVNMENIIIKRKVREGWIFFNSDRSYRSEIFFSIEKRDKAIEKFLEKERQLLITRELQYKKEKELLKILNE